MIHCSITKTYLQISYDSSKEWLWNIKLKQALGFGYKKTNIYIFHICTDIEELVARHRILPMLSAHCQSPIEQCTVPCLTFAILVIAMAASRGCSPIQASQWNGDLRLISRLLSMCCLELTQNNKDVLRYCAGVR
jgi:hypothetical protein